MKFDQERAIQEAEDKENGGICFFKIENGFFSSTRHAPQLTVEMQPDDSYIHFFGDGLLRVFCDKGTVSLYWPHARYDEEGLEAPVFTGAHIEVFRDGYPLLGGASKPRFTKSDPGATVYATYEYYGLKHRESIRSFADSSDTNKGLKMQYGEEVWQIVGLHNPGYSVNTIQRINKF